MPMLSQSGSGSLTGADQTGAAIPEVRLWVVNEDSGSKVETASNESGLFRVTSLLPGRYGLEVEKAGFDNLVRRGLEVTTGQTVAVDLVLQVGGATEVLTIESALH